LGLFGSGTLADPGMEGFVRGVRDLETLFGPTRSLDLRHVADEGFLVHVLFLNTRIPTRQQYAACQSLSQYWEPEVIGEVERNYLPP